MAVERPVWMWAVGATATWAVLACGCARDEPHMDWEEIRAEADWGPRSQHTSLVFEGRMWVIAGDEGRPMADVWSSADGKRWREEECRAPWTARAEHGSVVFGDRIWILGGSSSGDLLADVWRTR